MISKICECIVLNSASFLISLLMILRAGSAAYQYFTGKLQRSCFAVENGLLLQTPFTGGCMSEVDQAIMYLSGISLFCSFLAFLVLNHVLRIALLSKQKYTEILTYVIWELGCSTFCYQSCISDKIWFICDILCFSKWMISKWIWPHILKSGII